jgi:hypothetical protein
MGHVYAQSFRILMRDFLPIMAIAYLVSGAGTVAQGLLAAQMAGDKQPLDAVIPWLMGFIPFALADGGIVWVALRRLGGAQPVALRGVFMLAGIVLAVDLVENTPDLIALLLPNSIIAPLGQYYLPIAVVVSAIWLTFWMPALGVAVSERVGGPTSLGRGLALTGGHRWALFTVVLTLQLALQVATSLVGTAMVQVGLGAAPVWSADLITLPIWALSSVSQAVIYWELMRLKTGVTPAGVADVFG